MMRKTLVFGGGLLALCGSALAADPVISGVAFAQDANTRIVTGEYTLENGPAYVTAEVMTNGTKAICFLTSVTGGALSTVDGVEAPINRFVESGAHSFQWRADADMPGLDDPAASLKVRMWTPSAPPEYVLVGLTEENDVHYYASTNDLPFGSYVTNEIYKTDYLLMRRIPARGARWRMGLDPKNSCSVAAYAGHDTYHYVNMTNDYYLSVFEVTQRQYCHLMGTASGSTNFTDEAIYPDHWLYPALNISLATAYGEVSKLASGSLVNRLRKLTGLPFTLPTEEQWEYACRAGTGTAFSDGTDENCTAINEVSWNNTNSQVNKKNQPHQVGLKKPNPWGLYDMHGNAFELTLSYYTNSVTAVEVTEPVLRPEASVAFRSGSYSYNNTASASSAARYDIKDCCGVRLMLSIDPVAYEAPEKLDVSAWPFWGCADSVTNRAESVSQTATASLVTLDEPAQAVLTGLDLGIFSPGFLLIFR